MATSLGLPLKLFLNANIESNLITLQQFNAFRHPDMVKVTGCLGKNALLMSQLRGEWPDCLEQMGRGRLLQPTYADEHL